MVTPVLDHGGTQRYMSTMANHWVKLRHRVHIVLLREGEPFYDIDKSVKISELHYNNKGKFVRVYSALRAMYKLRKIIKNESPDFVLSSLSSTNIFTYFSTIFLDIKLYFREAMSPYRKRSRLENWLRKIIYKHVKGVIVMTHQAKAYVLKETKNHNVKVIPNPVRNLCFENTIKKENLIINVGRLVPVKGQEYLIRACANLNRPDWKFVILGEGESRKKLEQLAKDLKVEDYVLFLGAVREVNDWLLKSRIFVSTSLSEAWGNAICEAMAAGLPVIAFDCDVSPREIITHQKDGYLVENKNLEQLCKTLKILMGDEAKREKIGHSAIIKSKEFSLDKVSNQVLSFVTQ